MRIIISPAKKMTQSREGLPWRDLPCFLDKTETLLSHLQKMNFEELKNLWKCNDQIASLNVRRLEHMDLRRHLSPAILSYEGIQYQHMAPHVFTSQEYEYLQEHLRILSGFYGILRPFDGVTPYRLEMQAKLNICDTKDLYTYWNKLISDHLFSEASCIINLASKEYSACVSKHLTPDVRFITCVFGEEKNGKIVEKGTLCKMARGEMVRYMAEHQITSPEKLKSFDRLGFSFDPKRSDDSTYVFLKA